MPITFHERGDVSMIDLIRESSYVKDWQTVKEQHIESYLRECPRLVEEWIQYSEDQRCSPAWYILRPSEGKPNEGWIVGRHPTAPQNACRFSNPFAACACFIKLEAEELRVQALGK
jgi:hypothetical protein